MKLFTSSEVAKIVNLPAPRIHAFVRAGFIRPLREKRSLRFTFRDLIFLKTAKGLLDSSVPFHSIVRMLGSLRRQVPADRDLSSVKIYADGRRIVAWDGKARWQPDSGQFLFNFAADQLIDPFPVKAVPGGRKNNSLTAEHWFNIAVELESTSLREAARAYALALTIDPGMPSAHLNLGRIHHEAKEFREAERHYRAAAAGSPWDAAPRFNLGVLMEDRARPLDALEAYREAVRLDPAFADAHYNLGLLFEALGKKAEAVVHLRTARKLYRNR